MISESAQPFVTRFMQPGDRPQIIELVKSLKEFFSNDIIPSINDALENNNVMVGALGAELVGFLIYAGRDDQSAEIIWMGVKEKYHGLGLGTMMLDDVEKKLEENGIKKLIISTLSYTVPYKPYERVRSFLYHRGFKSLGIQSNYYEEGLDRLILVKQLH